MITIINSFGLVALSYVSNGLHCVAMACLMRLYFVRHVHQNSLEKPKSFTATDVTAQHVKIWLILLMELENCAVPHILSSVQ